jgi:hypothetical protein
MCVGGNGVEGDHKKLGVTPPGAFPPAADPDASLVGCFRVVDLLGYAG